MMFFEVTIVLLMLFFGLIYKLWTSTLNYWEKKGVPSLPGTIPFGTVGKLLLGKETTSQLFERLYTSYPDAAYVGFYGPYTPHLLIREPDLIKEVMLKNLKCFTNWSLFPHDIDPILAYNPFSMQNYNEWKFKRGILSPLMTVTKVKAGVSDLKNISRTLIKHLQELNGDATEVAPLCSNFTVDSLAQFAFGLESDSFFNSAKAFPIDTPMHLMSDSASLGLRCALFSPWLNRIMRNQMFDYKKCMGFMEMISSNIAARKNENSKGVNFFQRISDANEKLSQEGKPNLTNEETVGLFMTIFFDGTESVSSATLGVLYQIAINGEVQEKLRSEIKGSFEGVDDIDGETLSSLPYLDQCIYEGLRMHSAFPVIWKKCSQDTRLGTLEVRKGQYLFIPTEQLLIDAKYYPEPQKFDPDRWSSKESKARNRFTWLTFGEGPRSCLGKGYALVVMKLLLASILLEFKIVPENLFEKSAHLFLFSTPKNLKFKFHHLGM